MRATVGALLAEGRRLGLDRLDGQALLGHVLARPRTWLLAHEEAAVDEREEATWRELATRRADGEPLAYLVGGKEFHGLALAVDGRVLVPRPDTETLVDRAIELLRGPGQVGAPTLVDLGTGSGAIVLACKAAVPTIRAFASDLSEGALAVARANAARLDLDVTWRQGSWWAPWDGLRFDLAVANPPYVAEGDPHLSALRFEPPVALTAGPDGLEAMRHIVSAASAHLRPGGSLWVEHGFDQGSAVADLFAHAGFEDVQSRRDLAGHVRCTGGRLAGAESVRQRPLNRV